MNETLSNASALTSHKADVTSPTTAFAFEDEQKIFTQLISSQEKEITKCKKRRELRRHRVEIQKLREKGELSNDCTIIPDRTIDQNIRAETVAYSKFIQESSWVLAFKDVMQPTETFDPLNNFTTYLFRPPGWKKVWLAASDSRLLHGGVALELIPDPSAPGKAKIEYIRREDLLIPEQTRDIQACMRVGRRYEITKQQFKTLATALGFEESAKTAVLKHYETREEFIKVYKWFMKDDNGVVNIAFFADTSTGLNTYLRAPIPYQLGMFDLETPPVPPEAQLMMQLGAQIPPPPPVPKPRPVTRIPIYLIPYHIEEDETYYEVQGRAALDMPTQEALTAVLSATVNGAVRAAQLYPTCDPGIPDSEIKKDPLFTLKPDHVYAGKFTFAQLPWPNAIALSVVQTLSTRNAQASGQTDFASMSREDSAKRATELQMAAKEAEDLSSVGVSLWSEYQLQLYLDWWEIIKSQIVIKGIELPPDLAASGIDLSSPTLSATMAADIQVVKRAETTARRVQFYQLVQGTKFQEPYFETMIEELFPDDVDKWKLAIQQSDQTKQILAAAFQILSTLPLETVNEDLRPQFKQLLTAMQQIVAPPQPNEQTQPQPAGPPPAMANGPSNQIAV